MTRSSNVFGITRAVGLIALGAGLALFVRALVPYLHGPRPTTAPASAQQPAGGGASSMPGMDMSEHAAMAHPEPAGGAAASMPGMDMTEHAAGAQQPAGSAASSMPGMDMSEHAAMAQPAESAPTAKVEYTCPMHPAYRSDEPGNCPICGMALVRVPSSKAGRTGVTVPTDVQSRLGMRFADAQRLDAHAALTLAGRSAWDETLTQHVHSRTPAYVEHVFVEYVGAYVRAGYPLAELRSPEIETSERELVAALEHRDALAARGTDATTVAEGLVRAAKERLELLGVAPSDVAELEQSRHEPRPLLVRSPVDGIVTDRLAYAHGMQVSPDMELFTIQASGAPWILAQVHEADAPLVTTGQPAVITVPATGAQLAGTVTFLAPALDPATRTLAARIELGEHLAPADAAGALLEHDLALAHPRANPAAAKALADLPPGTYVTVTLSRDLGEKVVVPEEALLDSGRASRVFVQREDGSLQPKLVTPGPSAAEGRVIEQGLDGGERVLASANFLVDSEARLSGALADSSFAGATGAAP